MEVQTQILVFSEKPHKPPALDEVQKCYLKHILHLYSLSPSKQYSVLSVERIRKRKEFGKKLNWVELTRTIYDSSKSSFKCK